MPSARLRGPLIYSPPEIDCDIARADWAFFRSQGQHGGYEPRWLIPQWFPRKNPAHHLSVRPGAATNKLPELARHSRKRRQLPRFSPTIFQAGFHDLFELRRCFTARRRAPNSGELVQDYDFCPGQRCSANACATCAFEPMPAQAGCTNTAIGD